MEFISAEQFLKEDKEVQEVIDNSIKLCIGDRIYHKLSEKYYIYLGEYNEGFWNVFDLDNKCTGVFCKDYFCRCFTEGELRKFVEDKTGIKHIELVYYPKTGYDIYTENILFEDLGNDLLQSYWKVAVRIAKESIKY